MISLWSRSVLKTKHAGKSLKEIPRLDEKETANIQFKGHSRFFIKVSELQAVAEILLEFCNKFLRPVGHRFKFA